MVYKIGEISALITAFSWTAAAMIFEKTSIKTGVTATNTLKVFFGTIYLAFFAFLFNGNIIPKDVGLMSLLYISLSGFLGFVIGDYLLFNAYVLIGSRISMLLMSISVPLTAILSYYIFGESMGKFGILGIFLTVVGIGITIMSGKNNIDNNQKVDRQIGENVINDGHKHYIKGTIFGLLSGVIMAFSTLLTKAGAVGVPPVSATQIRILSAFIGFVVYSLIFNKQKEIINALKDVKGLSVIAIGSIFGPFIGVGALLYALQHTNAGSVATISSLSPILIIFPTMIFFKKKVLIGEILGAIIAVTGVALLFI